MDLQGIIDRLLPILPTALITALVFIGVSYLSYALYRKRGGRRNVTARQVIAIFLILAWCVVVMVLTTFSRGANYEGWVNFRLFSGYVNAWNQWSLQEWQLIIFNMLMFAPLGFLLPLLNKTTRRFVPVLLLSLLITLGIECIQMLSRRGIFELDDILHNTLGSMAGFFVMSAILDIVEQRKIAVSSAWKALSIPLFFALLFAGALFVYNMKELGNLSIRPAIAQDMSDVKVTLNADLPTEAEPVSLYSNRRIHNLKYGKEMAELTKRTFDLQQQGGMRMDGFNRIWILVSDDGKEYTFNYAVRDGGWSLSTEGDGSGPMEQEELFRHGEYYESLMLSSGILPPNAVFSTQNEDTIRWDIEQSIADIARGNRDYASGMVMIVPSGEHQIPHSLFYSMQENKFVSKIEIISPAQAYMEVAKGNFYVYNDLENGDQLNVDEYELTYTYDSKGYYQPVYRFTGTVNGSSWSTLIPAVK
ncbi:VanZ family protein [Paenibacillus lentus]|uniref:VanZ family protein n=1 Tax=Paenibacillus lentus TaxID=1338368 RepID=A0A3S8S065_9BACL|nr:VanZ family protein [Paenibacillus lentus]AZK48545.1 VanZ family protein [Paenibacillus lentus]